MAQLGVQNTALKPTTPHLAVCQVDETMITTQWQIKLMQLSRTCRSSFTNEMATFVDPPTDSDAHSCSSEKQEG